jgi:predicted glycosyltransferase
MKVTVTVSTPKHAHIWGAIVPELRDRGHEVQVLMRDYGETLPVADGIGLKGEIFGRCNGGGYRRMAETPVHMANHLRLSWKFDPDILAGTGLFETHSAKWLGKPGIAITDTEEAPIQNKLTRMFADRVLVPESFQTNPFGDKIRRIPGYLELVYLHPGYFEPDSSIYDHLPVEPEDGVAVVLVNG